ncbi:MAG: type II toxin-antitoxin system HicA family toxin [Finegoldia sp.]|uniref:type II toxin-antitoxin system HicA family toxin n=1 Tax=Finegoldia sp. TaxID=1981334 RepID=UPI003993D03B
MPMTQKEMVKLLKQHGFVEVKSEGKCSHIKMKKSGVRSIPVPKGVLKKGTERQILKQEGLL